MVWIFDATVFIDALYICSVPHFGFMMGVQLPLLPSNQGLRAMELCALVVSDVINSKGEVRDILRLTSDKTKGKKHRDLPLINSKVRATISAYMPLIWVSDHKAPLFKTQRGNKFTPNSMQQMIRQLFKNAGFDGRYAWLAGLL